MKARANARVEISAEPFVAIRRTPPRRACEPCFDRQIKDLEARAARELSQAEKMRTLHDTIAAAAAHLGG